MLKKFKGPKLFSSLSYLRFIIYSRVDQLRINFFKVWNILKANKIDN